MLDLDNTLWGGIVGEEGIDGIALGFRPPGSHFLAFQQAVLDLYNRGVILAINSKNNPKDALQVMREHPNMILKEQHFAAIHINWQKKDKNLREIAKKLNISTDSLVFLDDDPMNRSLVRATLPEVTTPDLPKNPEEYASFLLGLPYFASKAVTEEDKMRGNLYVTERLRKSAEETHKSKKEFLRHLSITVACGEDDASAVARLSQLSLKTNQFNTFKKPISEEKMRSYIGNPCYSVFHANARDKFGDYGIIGFALAQKKPKEWLLVSLLLSCRALGRGIEEAFVSYVAQKCKEDNNKTLRVLFKETEKNLPAEEFVNKYFNDKSRVLNKKLKKPDWIQYT